MSKNAFAALLGAAASLSGQRSTLYKAARESGDLNAAIRAVRTGSLRPLVVRGENKLIGRVTGRLYRR